MLIVVEYDEEIIEVVDWVVDIGLGVGVNGGEVVYLGLYLVLFVDSDLMIGEYFFGWCEILMLIKCCKIDKKWMLSVVGVCVNNFCNVMVDFLLGVFIVVIGVSGFGKFLLVNDIFY